MMTLKSTSLKNFTTAFKLVFKATPGLTVVNFFISFIQSIFPLIVIYLIKELIDAVGYAVTAEDKAQALDRVMWVVIFSGAAFLVNALANAAAQYVREFQSQKFSDIMYDKLHRKAAKLDLAFFENARYHDMFYRALQEAPYRPVKIVNSVFFMIQSFLAISILAVLLISLHWVIAIVLLLATVPAGYIRARYAARMYKWQKENTHNERKSYYFSRILTNEVFAKELRLFQLHRFFENNFKNIRAWLIDSKLRILRKKTLLEMLAQVVAAAAIFSAYGFISYKAAYGSISLGALVMYFMALQKGMNFFKDFLNSFAALYEDNLYIENLMSFLGLKNKMTYTQKPNHFPEKIQKGIVLENVSFKYPNSRRHALENINMHIRPNSTVAIVGDNGAGKTTLVKLLCHLYEPDSGTIRVDGIPLNTINDKDIKTNISVLFQDFVLYHLTAKENIWFGNTAKEPTDDTIKEAAQKAGVENCIDRLPQKYETVLGKLFDGSEELSIGEWQKMALARAFFKDSSVIILDEPTSALDPQSEYDIFKKFKSITQNKTSIIVSHRFSTVKMADYIYVMKKERIVEEGTHESLITQNGVYAEMFRMQSENYQT